MIHRVPLSLFLSRRDSRQWRFVTREGHGMPCPYSRAAGWAGWMRGDDDIDAGRAIILALNCSPCSSDWCPAGRPRLTRWAISPSISTAGSRSARRGATLLRARSGRVADRCRPAARRYQTGMARSMTRSARPTSMPSWPRSRPSSTSSAGATSLPLRLTERNLALLPGQAGLETTRLKPPSAPILRCHGCERRRSPTAMITRPIGSAGARSSSSMAPTSASTIQQCSPSTNQNALRVYPNDLLSSPLDERTVTAAYQLSPGAPGRRAGGATPIASGPRALASVWRRSSTAERLLNRRPAPGPPRRRGMGRRARALARSRQDRRRRLSGRQPGHASSRLSSSG